ncbi:unnamed protein product [Amoebophrya sp. A120]|nr:unnamed protein product [Amoebophrya sp. A120]|eukprot:GSA120T00000708001.1
MYASYRVLGLQSGVSYEDAKRKYRKLCLQKHPDKPSGNKEEFVKINEAWNFLQENVWNKQPGAAGGGAASSSSRAAGPPSRNRGPMFRGNATPGSTAGFFTNPNGSSRRGAGAAGQQNATNKNMEEDIKNMFSGINPDFFQNFAGSGSPGGSTSSSRGDYPSDEDVDPGEPTDDEELERREDDKWRSAKRDGSGDYNFNYNHTSGSAGAGASASSSFHHHSRRPNEEDWLRSEQRKSEIADENRDFNDGKYLTAPEIPTKDRITQFMRELFLTWHNPSMLRKKVNTFPNEVLQQIDWDIQLGIENRGVLWRDQMFIETAAPKEKSEKLLEIIEQRELLVVGQELRRCEILLEEVDKKLDNREMKNDVVSTLAMSTSSKNKVRHLKRLKEHLLEQQEELATEKEALDYLQFVVAKVAKFYSDRADKFNELAADSARVEKINPHNPNRHACNAFFEEEKQLFAGIIEKNPGYLPEYMLDPAFYHDLSPASPTSGDEAAFPNDKMAQHQKAGTNSGENVHGDHDDSEDLVFPGGSSTGGKNSKEKKIKSHKNKKRKRKSKEGQERRRRLSSDVEMKSDDSDGFSTSSSSDGDAESSSSSDAEEHGDDKKMSSSKKKIKRGEAAAAAVVEDVSRSPTSNKSGEDNYEQEDVDEKIDMTQFHKKKPHAVNAYDNPEKINRDKSSPKSSEGDQHPPAKVPSRSLSTRIHPPGWTPPPGAAAKSSTIPSGHQQGNSSSASSFLKKPRLTPAKAQPEPRFGPAGATLIKGTENNNKPDGHQLSSVGKEYLEKARSALDIFSGNDESSSSSSDSEADSVKLSENNVDQDRKRSGSVPSESIAGQHNHKVNVLDKARPQSQKQNDAGFYDEDLLSLSAETSSSSEPDTSDSEVLQARRAAKALTNLTKRRLVEGNKEDLLGAAGTSTIKPQGRVVSGQAPPHQEQQHKNDMIEGKGNSVASSSSPRSSSSLGPLRGNTGTPVRRKPPPQLYPIKGKDIKGQQGGAKGGGTSGSPILNKPVGGDSTHATGSLLVGKAENIKSSSSSSGSSSSSSINGYKGQGKTGKKSSEENYRAGPPMPAASSASAGAASAPRSASKEELNERSAINKHKGSSSISSNYRSNKRPAGAVDQHLLTTAAADPRTTSSTRVHHDDQRTHGSEDVDDAAKRRRGIEEDMRRAFQAEAAVKRENEKKIGKLEADSRKIGDTFFQSEKHKNLLETDVKYKQGYDLTEELQSLGTRNRDAKLLRAEERDLLNYFHEKSGGRGLAVVKSSSSKRPAGGDEQGIGNKSGTTNDKSGEAGPKMKMNTSSTAAGDEAAPADMVKKSPSVEVVENNGTKRPRTATTNRTGASSSDMVFVVDDVAGVVHETKSKSKAKITRSVSKEKARPAVVPLTTASSSSSSAPPASMLKATAAAAREAATGAGARAASSSSSGAPRAPAAATVSKSKKTEQERSSSGINQAKSSSRGQKKPADAPGNHSEDEDDIDRLLLSGDTDSSSEEDNNSDEKDNSAGGRESDGLTSDSEIDNIAATGRADT